MDFDSIKAYESYLNELSESEKPIKATIMNYWVKDYLNLLRNEKQTLQYRYERGTIVSAHLGYRIGHEHGGLHYCVVLNNNYSLNDGLLTVVPLTSIKDPCKPLFYTNVNLRNELKDLLTHKIRDVITRTETLRIQMNKILNILMKLVIATRDHNKEKLIDFFEYICVEANSDALTSILEDEIDTSFISELKNKLVNLDDYSEYNYIDLYNELKIGKLSDAIIQSEKIILDKQNDLDRMILSQKKQEKQIKKLKETSKALVDQIITVSAVRVKDPYSKYCPLANIKLSDESLDMIDSKISELFSKVAIIEKN